jgi:hypothetical protein
VSFQEVLWGVSLWICCCYWVNLDLELELNLNPARLCASGGEKAGETFFLEFLSVRDEVEDEDEDGGVAEVKRFLEVRACSIWEVLGSYLKPFIPKWNEIYDDVSPGERRLWDD